MKTRDPAHWRDVRPGGSAGGSSNGPLSRRVNFYAPTLHGVVLNFFPRGACHCREGALLGRSDFRRADQSSYVQHAQCRETQSHQHGDGWQAPARPPFKGYTPDATTIFAPVLRLRLRISVRANHWPRSVSRAEPCRRFMTTENIPSRARSATVTPEMCYAFVASVCVAFEALRRDHKRVGNRTTRIAARPAQPAKRVERSADDFGRLRDGISGVLI